MGMAIGQCEAAVCQLEFCRLQEFDRVCLLDRFDETVVLQFVPARA